MIEEGGKHAAVIRVVNKKGLHARAAAKIVEAAARFQSQISVTRDHQSVDALSIMGLMMLAASMGSEIRIEAHGPDAEEALHAILALVEAKFGED
ncbi:MAG TPA: HPr family phosphocarrier protein [Rhizomicrobium sp.]